MNKKILAGLMTVVMLTGIGVETISVTSFGKGITAEAANEDSDFTYKTDPNNKNGTDIIITSYSGVDTTINIPSKIDGLTVTGVGDENKNDNILNGNHYYDENDYCSIEKVVLPNTINAIYADAFNDFNRMTEIKIPNSVETIGNSAFSCCENLKEIVLPESVKSVGNSAFYYSGLTSVTVKNKNLKLDYADIPDGATIYGYKNSEAQKFVIAQNNNGKNYIFKELTETLEPTDPSQTDDTPDEDSLKLLAASLTENYIFYDNSLTGWNQVYAYWYNNNFEQMTNAVTGKAYPSGLFYFPGMSMQKLQGTEVYYCVAPVGADHIIFSDGVDDDQIMDGKDGYCTTSIDYSVIGCGGYIYKVDWFAGTTIGRGPFKTKYTYEDGNWDYYTVLENSIKLDKTTATVETGKKFTLRAVFDPVFTSDQTLKWTSSDPSIASVSKGTVTGKKVGTVTITAESISKKKASCTLTVKESTIALKNATLKMTSYTYDGTAKKPSVTVKDANDKTVASSNYTVTYSNNTKAGTATVKIIGKGSYTGTVTKSFKINAKNVTKMTTKLSATSYTYNGKAKNPTVTVKDGTKTLKKGTDYTVTYKNNTKPGKATVTIKGKGNYTGTITKTFTIKPKKATLKTATSPKTKQFKATWAKDTTVNGYQIQYSTNSKFTSGNKTKTISNNSTTSATITKLTKGKTYYVRVRSYKTIDGKKVYGAYSTAKKVKIK